jgi:hypothetical protein
MQGCPPSSSSSPPPTSVTLYLVSTSSPVFGFRIRLWVLGASGWAAVHEDPNSLLYLVLTQCSHWGREFRNGAGIWSRDLDFFMRAVVPGERSGS